MPHLSPTHRLTAPHELLTPYSPPSSSSSSFSFSPSSSFLTEPQRWTQLMGLATCFLSLFPLLPLNQQRAPAAPSYSTFARILPASSRSIAKMTPVVEHGSVVWPLASFTVDSDFESPHPGQLWPDRANSEFGFAYSFAPGVVTWGNFRIPRSLSTSKCRMRVQCAPGLAQPARRSACSCNTFRLIWNSAATRMRRTSCSVWVAWPRRSAIRTSRSTRLLHQVSPSFCE
jgi:hypothetical protein